MRFSKQVVIVTGASPGIGGAIAIAFAREGATVVLIARTRARLEETVTEIKQFETVSDKKCPAT